LPIGFSATLTTIPEPDTWTLVFIGLGILGAASRDRRSTHPPYSPRRARYGIDRTTTSTPAAL
jgi:hypothetical protein